MLIPELSSLLNSTSDMLPLVLVGNLFSFFSKNTNTPATDRKTLATINSAVIKFLEARGVTNFDVYTLDHEGNPVVLIKAEPQKKLRFSNILEIQIKKFLREKLAVDVPAVFWRFKVDYADTPGPEQVDYEFEDHPPYPQDDNTQIQSKTDSAADGTLAESAAADLKNSEQDELYNVQHATNSGMHVEEIAMGEFDQFLKGSLSQATDIISKPKDKQ